MGVLNLNKSSLDLNYLRDWAGKLNFLESLEGLLNDSADFQVPQP